MHSVSQTGIQTVRQAFSQTVSQTDRHSVRQWDRHSVRESVSQTDIQSVRQAFSLRCQTGIQSVRQAFSQSVRQTFSQAFSQRVSQTVSQSVTYCSVNKSICNSNNFRNLFLLRISQYDVSVLTWETRSPNPPPQQKFTASLQWNNDCTVSANSAASLTVVMIAAAGHTNQWPNWPKPKWAFVCKSSLCQRHR
jgi:hypothetical protein